MVSGTEDRAAIRKDEAMPAISNAKLKKLISKSAIKNSLIPLIICDENYVVCQKSIGAARLMPKPAQNSSILPHISEDTVKKMAGGDDPVCALFTIPSSEVFTVITKGVVANEKYYAFIFEPRILSVPESVPPYIAESYRRLCDTAKELIASEETKFSRFERSAAAMLRLADFRERISPRYLSGKSGFVDICKEIERVVNEYAELFSTVGMSIDFHRLSDEPQICAYPAEVIHIFASVLVSTAALLSADGNTEVVCGSSPESDSHTRISLIITSDKNGKQIEKFEDLMFYAAPLSLELAAIIDMAEHYGFKLICSSGDGKLNIAWEVEARRSAVIKLHAPTRHTAENLRRMVAELFDVIMGADSGSARNVSSPKDGAI